MSIDHALWVHGHFAEIEHPDRVTFMVQKGYHVRIQGNPSTTNWLHFAVPTAAIVDDYRMRPHSILFRYKTDGGGRVEGVHVYDGETRIAADDSPTGSVDADGWTRIRVDVEGDEILAVRWGIGISIKMRFGRNGGRLEFESAGCDFESANRVSCQRLRISTNKNHSLELPYRSNMPIDVPNDAIERILISQHGMGGNAELYLRNGLAAAGLVAGALDSTLIIAPQFIYSREYYGRFPADLLHWDGGRAYGGESTELSTLRENVTLRGLQDHAWRSIVDNLHNITAPTLVIWGQQDRFIPVARAQVARDRIPNVRLQIIDRCGHMPQLERPDEFNALVLEFLASS